MILYFADRAMNILGFATTHKISDISIVDDYRTEETDTGISTLEVTVGYNKLSRLKAEAMAEAGNYILFSDDDEKKFYTIIDEEIDSEKKEVRVYAEDAGLDLINEIAGPFEAEEAHEPEWYINKYIKDSGFEIGLNELPESIKTLSWDGESTVTERLASIATKFGGFEISYSFEIRGLKVVHKYVNIHEKRGKDVGETLRIGREIKTIRTKKTVANLATALECEGGTLDGEDKPITLEGMGYDDGEFYTSGKKLCSRSALEKWSRYAWEEREGKGDGHIVQRYSYDTTDQEALCKHAIAELKKIYDVGINYEVDINYLPSNIEIGDRVNIVDNEGELYVSSRILEFKKSVTRGEYSTTLGEYLIRDKGIDDYLNDLADKVKEENQNTTLYTWIAYADDAEGNGISLDPEGKAYMGIAENRTTEEPDISDPSIYKWSKIQGEDGIHEVSSVDQYYLSTSDTECIGGEWSEEIPDWESGKYIWKRKKITWSDGSVTYTDPVLDKSMNSANESAQEAIKQSQNAAQSAEEALANVSQINKEVANIKSDASAIREEMKASIAAVKEEMTADYTKKTETETVEANLRAEISKSAAEIQTTMESNYAKKTELTEVSENLQTQITQNAEGITSTASSVESIRVDASNAQAKADEANAAIGELSNRVTTAETQISQNAEQISLRATKTEVEEKLSGYSTKTETESSISAMADSINLDVSSKFSELGIGNRNYIRNTRLMEGYGKSSNVTISTDEEGFAVATFSQVESLSYNTVSTRPPIPFSLLRNKTITFSIWVRSDDFEQINAESNRGLLVSFALCTSTETTRTKYHDTAFYASKLSNEWKKITVTHTLSDSFFGSGSGEIDDTTRFMLQIYNYSLYSLQFKKIKLEIGDEATEWVAAQEDEASTIDSLRASLELKVDKDKMISEINASADVITLNGNRFIVNADNFSLTAEGRMTSTAGKIAGWDINEDGLSVAYSGNFPFAGGTLGTEGIAHVKLYSKPDSVELEAVQIGSSGVSLKGSSVYAVKILDYHLDDANSTHEGTTTFGIGKDGNTIIHNSSSNYISIGDTVDTYGDMNIYGKIKTKYSIAPMTENSGKFACGLDDARWSTVYSNDVNADGKIYFPGVTSSTSVTRTLYMGATAGQLYYKTSQSSKMIKHDVFPLRNEDIMAERLYDLEVVQFKYNEDVLSSDDQRYMTDMPGFIIEQMNEVYPIAVDKETENVKDWAWNVQYLIPGMVKLLQNDRKDIDSMSARIDSLNYMLEQAFNEIAILKKENETLKQALA